jgi:hypothetical protein
MEWNPLTRSSITYVDGNIFLLWESFLLLAVVTSQILFPIAYPPHPFQTMTLAERKKSSWCQRSIISWEKEDDALEVSFSSLQTTTTQLHVLWTELTRRCVRTSHTRTFTQTHLHTHSHTNIHTLTHTNTQMYSCTVVCVWKEREF